MMLYSNDSDAVFSFKVDNGDAGLVLDMVKNFISDFEEITHKKLNFGLAEVRMDMDKITQNPKNPNYYPLTVYDTKDGITLRISEFRVGYRGYSVDKLIECLQYLGFNVRQSTMDAIYNNRKVKITLWKDGQFKCY